MISLRLLMRHADDTAPTDLQKSLANNVAGLIVLITEVRVGPVSITQGIPHAMEIVLLNNTRSCDLANILMTSII